MVMAICLDDLVIGTASGSVDGWPIPDGLSRLPLEQLRLLSGEIIDARENRHWFIDFGGRKHITPGEGYQPLECALTDRLYMDADGHWRTAGIAEVRDAKLAVLSSACEAAIIGGFTSDALGAAHRYPSNITDQINLMGSVTDSLVPGLPDAWQTPFWVMDGNGIWSWKMHSATQIQQAGRDGKAHVVYCQTLLAELTVTVQNAQTEDEVSGIVWPGV